MIFITRLLVTILLLPLNLWSAELAFKDIQTTNNSPHTVTVWQAVTLGRGAKVIGLIAPGSSQIVRVRQDLMVMISRKNRFLCCYHNGLAVHGRYLTRWDEVIVNQSKDKKFPYSNFLNLSVSGGYGSEISDFTASSTGF